MSTPAEEIVASSAAVERRFYSRVCPSGMVGIAFGEENAGMVLNVSENGLLVSTPSALSRDTVFPLSLRLDGLPDSIEVIGRVVWTVDTNRAGIQLLNLRDHDREQIRIWSSLGADGNDGPSQAEVRGDERVARVDGGVPGALAKRSLTRVWLAAGAAIVVVALAMGLSLRESPLRLWLSRATQAAEKELNPGKKGEVKLGPEVASGPGANSGAHEEAAGQMVASSPAGNTAEDTGSNAAAPARRDLSGKKNVAKENSPVDLKRADSGALDASGSEKASTDQPAATHPSTPEDEMEAGADNGAPENGAAASTPETTDSVAKKSAEDGAGAKSGTDSVLPIPLDSNHAPASGSPSGGATSGDPHPVVHPEVNPRAAPLHVSNPVVIRMDGPKSEVVEVALPNSPGATLVNLPGEKVIPSAVATMHVQRSVVVAGVQGWWSSSRRKKVVLGELLERVDPQTPRVQSQRDERVSVRAMIGKDGRIESLRPVNGSIALVPSVVRAIREWRFEPTLVDGKPVETGVFLVVEFHAVVDGASKP